MQESKTLFERELIFLNQEFKTKREFFEKVSYQLVRRGYANISFVEAIATREENYPTGLRTSHFDVAIPHTDPEHIKRPFIAFIRTVEPIPFMEMGSIDKEVSPKIFFIIGLQKGSEQLGALQKLVKIFNNEPLMINLINIDDTEEIYKKIIDFYYENP